MTPEGAQASGVDLYREAQRIEDEITAACETSFRVFLREAWRYIYPVPFVTGWHLDAKCDALQAVTRGLIQNLVINEPPRNSKTTVVSIAWPAWEWGPANRPNRRGLFTSYGSTRALDSAVRCRRLMQTRWYQQRWGHRFRFSSDQNVKSRYENDQGGSRISSSFESGITGEGGDFLVVDDPSQLDDADNVEKLKHVVDEWDGTMSSRLDNPETANRIIIMHRLNERDLTGHVLDQAKRLHQQWHHLCLPMEFERSRRCRIFLGGRVFFEDPRTNDGELLNAGRFNAQHVADLKTVNGSYRYAGLYQQRPAPATGGIFQRGWWRYWQMLPPVFDEWLQSWDMTFGAKHDGASFVCGQVWARVGAFKYLIDQVRERMTFPETVRAVEQMTAKWPLARLKLVEKKANGLAVIQSLQDKIPGFVAVEVVEDKPARARAVSPDVESGSVYLPHESVRPWVGEFVEETAVFPRAGYNDQVDTMTQALRRWHRTDGDGAVAVIRAPR